MSLINQMLRDLDERREQKTAQIHEINLPRPPGSPFPWIPVMASAAISLIVSAGLFWYIADNQYQSAPVNERVAAAPDPEAESPTQPAAVPLRPARPEAPSREIPAIALPRILDGVGVPGAEVPQAGDSVPVQAAESNQSPSGAQVSRAQEPGQGGTAESPVEDAGQQAPEGRPTTDAEELSYLPLIVSGETAQTASEPRQTDNPSTALKRESSRTEKTEVSVLESVQKYVSEGRLAEAEAALWRELKLHPDAVDVRESLATLLIRGKRHVEAMALVQQGRGMMPDYPPLVGLQARILLDQDETGAARSLLEGHLNGRESDQVLLSMLGVVYQREGAFLKAQAVYARLLELDRTSAGYWAGLAIALDAANDEVRSLEAFRRALALGGLPVAVYDYARQRVMALSGK